MKTNNIKIRKIIKNNLFMGIASLILLIMSSALTIIMAFFLGKVINAALELDLETFKKTILLITLIVISAGIFELLGQNLKYKFAKRATIEYKQFLINNFLKFNFKEFNKFNTSYYLNILVGEVDLVEDHYFLQLISIVQNIVQAVIGIGALIFINWKFAMATLIVFFIPQIIPGFLGRILGKKKLIQTEQEERYIIGVKGLLEGFELIKTHDLYDKMLGQYKNSNMNVENAKYDFSKVDNAKDVMVRTLATIAQIAAIAIGVVFVFRGSMTVPLLFAGIQIIGNIMQPIAFSVQRYTWLMSTKPIISKHFELISSSSKNEKTGDYIESIQSITIENLSFSYDDKNIIDDISYCFEKGKKYVIVGESGSGKSTLLKLIMGYFDDYTGDILYSNKNLKDINSTSLYNNISVVHQNVFLFEDTLKNNVNLYKTVDQSLYEKSILKTNLNQVENRLLENDSRINDNGKNLSGGEKQRIGIARCLVNKSEVLFIDEATSNLDPKNSAMFYNIIKKLNNTTCIAITHERDTNILQCFDEILLLENKKLRRVSLEEVSCLKET